MLSIIIPTYQESLTIAPLVKYLRKTGGDAIAEILVCDGGSTDLTREMAAAAGATVIPCAAKGRAAQMNEGALLAKADVLYFVHADCFPPATFVDDIRQSLEAGFSFGRYRTRFDSRKWILKVNAFFTRFDLFICSGGDQTLFITKDLFQRLQGFSSDMRIMEDYDIVTRGRQLANYKIMQKDVLVSARKYASNSWLSVQLANYRIVKMYKRGASQTAMASKYRELLHFP